MKVCKHEDVSEQDLPYGCSVCGKQFATSTKLGVHSKCHLGTQNQTDLSTPAHSICSSNKRPFSCSECGKGFYQSSNLESHLHIHAGKVLYKCKICHKKFALRSVLERHLQQHSSEDAVPKTDKSIKHEHSDLVSGSTAKANFKNPISCHLCGKFFKEAQYLSIHMRVHSGEKPHRCNICKKSFSQLGNFMSHMRTHSGEKPYLCDLCDKTFVCSGNRDSHRRTHTGEKPYMCDICGLSFSRPNSLKMHHNLHTGDRPYPCDECDKAFVSSGKLVEHKRTHSGEKPYTCETCGLSFAIVNTLKRHRKIHSGEKSHSCHICGKQFFRREGMRSHLKTHTGQTKLFQKTADACTIPKLGPDESNYKENKVTGHIRDKGYNMASSNYSSREVIPLMYNKCNHDKNDIHENSEMLDSLIPEDVLNKYGTQTVNTISNKGCVVDNMTKSKPHYFYPPPITNHECDQNSINQALCSTFPNTCVYQSISRGSTKNHLTSIEIETNHNITLPAVPAQLPNSPSVHFTEAINKSKHTYLNGQTVTSVSQTGNVPVVKSGIHTWSSSSNCNVHEHIVDGDHSQDEGDTAVYSCCSDIKDVQADCNSTCSNMLCLEAFATDHSHTEFDNDYDKTCMYHCTSNNENIGKDNFVLGSMISGLAKKSNETVTEGCYMASNNDTGKTNENVDTGHHYIPNVINDAKTGDNIGGIYNLATRKNETPDRKEFCAFEYVNSDSIGICTNQADHGNNTAANSIDTDNITHNGIHVDARNKNTENNSTEVVGDNRKHCIIKYFCEDYRMNSNNKECSKEYSIEDYTVNDNSKDHIKQYYNKEVLLYRKKDNKDCNEEREEGINCVELSGSNDHEYFGDHQTDAVVFRNKLTFTGSDQECLDNQQDVCRLNDSVKKTTGPLTQSADDGHVLENVETKIGKLTQDINGGDFKNDALKDDEKKISKFPKNNSNGHIEYNELEDGEEMRLVTAVESNNENVTSWAVSSAIDQGLVRKKNTIRKSNNTSEDFTTSLSVKSVSQPGVQCDICSKVFSRSASLKSHMKNHINTKKFSSTRSNKSSPAKYHSRCKKNTTNNNLIKSFHHHISPCMEDIVKEQISVGSKLRTMKPVISTYDEFPGTEPTIRDQHNKNNTRTSKIKCAVCKISFVQRMELDEHLKLNPDHLIKCRMCGKEFQDRQYLKLHSRVHTQEKPYKCKECGKGFTQSGNFVTHMRVHTGYKPYVCDICNKAFTSSGNRDSHRRTHTGVKPYMCDVCGENFSRPSSLTTHRRTHTGERPYQCDVCQKAFISSGKLADHCRVHTGEKPYTCEICGRSFAIVNTFRRHKRIHSGDRPHKCGICTKSFIRLEGLRSHLKTHDKNKKMVLAATPGGIFNTNSDQSHLSKKDLLINMEQLEHQKDVSTVHTYTNAITDKLIVPDNAFNGYPSLCVSEFKQSQMSHENNFNISQTLQYEVNSETANLQNQNVCYYNQNIGSIMGTFIYPESQGCFHHQS